MSNKNTKEIAKDIVDSLCDNYSSNVLQQVASSLFQVTLDIKKKGKWSSAEDDMLSTFFYLTSKEELCESLQCDMESLYMRARHLGVVRPTFDSMTAYDLKLAIDLFDLGKGQGEILDIFGIESVTTPVKSLSAIDHGSIREAVFSHDSSQMELEFKYED